MIKQQPLQDSFLNTIRKNSTLVSIYLVSGIKLQGKIDSFDQFTVFLRNNVVQMVYKHAIATIIPMQRDEKSQAPGKPAAHVTDAMPNKL